MSDTPNNYLVTIKGGASKKFTGTPKELRDKLTAIMARDSLTREDFKIERVNVADSMRNPIAKQDNTQTAIQEGPRKKTSGDIALDIIAPLTMATIENTKDVPQPWKGIAIGGAAVGDAGLTLMPAGKAIGVGKAASKAYNPASKIMANGLFKEESRKNFGKYVKNAAEQGTDAAIYEGIVQGAEGEFDPAKLAGATAGGGALGGFLGGRTEINAERAGKKAAADARKAKAIEEKAMKAAGKEMFSMDEIANAVSKSNKNINFAKRMTGEKDPYKAFRKIVGDNIKEGETLPAAAERLTADKDKAERLRNAFMDKYGSHAMPHSMFELRRNLVKNVNEALKGSGFLGKENLTKEFAKLLDDDFAELAAARLAKEGYGERQIKARLLDYKGDINVKGVAEAFGEGITLSEMNEIKKRMWQKTGIFNTNPGSIQRHGKRNTAGYEGGFAVNSELRELGERETQMLEKIGFAGEEEAERLGNQYIANLRKNGILTSEEAKEYIKLNKEYSNLIGVTEIIESANRRFTPNTEINLHSKPVHSTDQWQKLREQAGKEELLTQMPEWQPGQMTEQYISSLQNLRNHAAGQKAGNISGRKAQRKVE